MIKKSSSLLSFLAAGASLKPTQHLWHEHQDQATMTEMFAHAGEGGSFLANRGDKIYIPVKFHLVADDNGKGRGWLQHHPQPTGQTQRRLCQT